MFSDRWRNQNQQEGQTRGRRVIFTPSYRGMQLVDRWIKQKKHDKRAQHVLILHAQVWLWDIYFWFFNNVFIAHPTKSPSTLQGRPLKQNKQRRGKQRRNLLRFKNHHVCAELRGEGFLSSKPEVFYDHTRSNNEEATQQQLKYTP